MKTTLCKNNVILTPFILAAEIALLLDLDHWNIGFRFMVGAEVSPLRPDLLQHISGLPCCWKEQRKSRPYIDMHRSWAFQEVGATRFQENRHTKVAWLSAQRTGRLYQVLFSIRVWVEPRDTVAGRIMSVASGIEPATFRLLAQCLNQRRHRVPRRGGVISLDDKTAGTWSLSILSIWCRGLLTSFCNRLIRHWEFNIHCLF
jgi:hypothetical protein